MANIADIVFLIDNTGSMSRYIEKVRNNINNFANSLKDSGIDYRLGLISFGDIADSKIKKYDFTSDTNTFIDEVNEVADNLTGGGDLPESGLEALMDSDTGALSMDFRSDASKHFVVVTDDSFHNQGESGSGNSSAYLETSDVENALLDNDVVMDVVGTVRNSKPEWEPLANATGGEFYDIDGDFPTIFDKITDEISDQSVDVVTVDLNDVGESETGIFVVTSYVTDSVTSITSTATFKSDAEASDTIVGEVTADKVYVAASDTEFSQNITIPEGWNVTATENNDRLHIDGDNATVTGGAGNDRFYVSSEVSAVKFTDFTPADDYISFSSHIEPGSMADSVVDDELFISNDDMGLTFGNTASLTTELSNESVNNGGTSNTIGELINGVQSETSVVVNPTAPVMMSLAHWRYGFYPAAE